MTTVFSCLVRPFTAITAIVLCSGVVDAASETKAIAIASPDGQVAIHFYLNADGVPRYAVQLDGKPVLQESRLGLVRDDADFSRGLRLVSESRTKRVRDKYEILTAKRRVNTYLANQRTFHLQTAAGQKMDIIFQVSNDGVAFRYFFPEPSAKEESQRPSFGVPPSGGTARKPPSGGTPNQDLEVRKLTEEVSSFHFLPGTRAWLQPMSVAKSGWERTNPSYEEYYEKEIPVGTPSPTGAGWVYPALFRSGDIWLLVSETALGRNYCGTRLRSESPDGEYSVGFPDPKEDFKGGPVNPESTLPWLTPWRVIVVGSLKTVTESMLGVDLADKPARSVKLAHKPGKASWSWPLMGDGNTKYDVQRRFIDYAAEMGWRYCLVDALWDKQIGYEKIQELIDYGRQKGVAILLWYNSAGDWNGAPQTPRDLMHTRETRIKEFDRLKKMGVAGLKVDFFGGDGQSVIGYYHDILEDTAKYGFAMNFHGATLPRGWQRTYPHLMTVEAIRGLEFVTFEQRNADQEPSHATMLPLTRNVFDPMDFTPTVLDRINRIQRRTTSAFELALAVLFTSGIQHYAEIPEGMAKAPDYVRDFIKGIPSVWDDVKFLDGDPGKFVVVARKGEGRWYVAGINGEATERKLSLDLGELRIRGKATLIADGDGGNLSFRQETVNIPKNKALALTLPPNGGFVLTFK